MDKIKYLTSKEVAELLGVTEDCIRKWDKSGKLKPDQLTEGGHRRYSFDKITSLIKEQKLTKEFIEYGREEWLERVCKKLNGEWEQYTLKTTLDGYPVMVLSDRSIDNYPKIDYEYHSEGTVCTFFNPDDEIILMSNKYENRSYYSLNNHPSLHNGWYITDMRHRYTNTFEQYSKHNIWSLILRKELFEYIDDLWFYINWVFYFSENGKGIIKEDRISGEEFINSLINDNYTGVLSKFEDSIGVLQEFNPKASKWIEYENFLSRFACQVWNYVLRNRIDKEREYSEDKTIKDRVRRLFKNGDYKILLIEHNGFIYTCENNEENNSGNILHIRIDDDDKFNAFINSLTKYSISCEKMVSHQTIIVDDLLNKLEIPVKTKKETIEIDTFTHDKLETYNEEPWRFMIKRAKCPYCGGELISKTPTIYNPFSFETSCVCECADCHKVIKTDKAYPHVTVWGRNGEEISDIRF